MPRLLACSILVIAITGTAYAATTPAPRWTPTQAAAQVMRWQPETVEAVSRVTVTAARCTGRGAPVKGRYLQFRCMTTFDPTAIQEKPTTVPLWVAVRRQGTGQPCVSLASLASVPSGCLAPAGARVRGSAGDAKVEVLRKMRDAEPAWPGVNLHCLGYGAGFYRCTWDDGRATVVFRPAGATVTVLPAG